MTNVSRTRSTVSADGPGRPFHFAAHRQPLCWNFMYHSRIVLSAGGSVRYTVRNLRCTVTIDSVLANSKTQNAFLFIVHAIFLHDYPLAVEPAGTPSPLVQKKSLRDSLPIDMLLPALSVLVVAQSSSEVPEGLMNNPVFTLLNLCFLPPEISCHMKHNVLEIKKNDGLIINVFIRCKLSVTLWILTTIGTGWQMWYFTESCLVGYALFVRRKGSTDGHGVTWRGKTWLFVTSLPTLLLKMVDVSDRK